MSDEGTKGRRQAYALSQSPQDSSEDWKSLHTLIVYQATNSAHIKPILRQVNWNGLPLTMFIDTGSPVSAVPRAVFKQHRGKWPRLQATIMKLSCFEGPLPIAGKLQLNATMGGATIQAKLVVVDCLGPALCGLTIYEASIRQLCRYSLQMLWHAYKRALLTEGGKPCYRSTMTSSLQICVCSESHWSS